jgi:hypothetical protein
MVESWLAAPGAWPVACSLCICAHRVLIADGYRAPVVVAVRRPLAPTPHSSHPADVSWAHFIHPDGSSSVIAAAAEMRVLDDRNRHSITPPAHSKPTPNC